MKDNIVQEEFYNDYKITIEYSEYSDSPDTWENEDVFLVYDHRSFQVNREGFKPQDIYEFCISNEVVQDNKFNNYHIFPIYAYIHSGVSLSLGNNTYPFNDRFDVSTTGFILVSKKEYSELEKAKNLAENLIETWNKYLSGEVYDWKIEEKILYWKIGQNELDAIVNPDNKINIKEFRNVANEEEIYKEFDSSSDNYDTPENLIKECKLIIDKL